MTGKLIVVIDDEEDILELIRFNLEKEGYVVKTATSGEEGWRLLTSLTEQEAPSAVLLDLMLPGIDGMSLCKRIKSKDETKSIPVIMLTAKSSESDVVSGLELGADDYVTKPFSPKILIARLRAVLRKKQEIEEAVELATENSETNYRDGTQSIQVGKLFIDITRHEVRCDQEIIYLSATEFAILEFLARNPGWVFSRNRIIDGIRGKDYPVTERSVDVQILGLRKKLGPLGYYLQTVRGVGYRLQAV